MDVPHIVELATRIAANTTKVGDYLTEHNLPQPSFGVDAPLYGCVPSDAPEIEALRLSVIKDTVELRDLMLGPRDYLFSFVVSYTICSNQATHVLSKHRTMFYLPSKQ